MTAYECGTPARRFPGLRALEKAAVRAGGGVNHRGSLSDFVLVKDNHLAGMTITDAVQRALAQWPGRAVEVECDRLEQVEEAITAGATMVLLDNMTPDQVRACVALARDSAPRGFLVEVSGGITLENIRQYADTGADLISTSVITQSAARARHRLRHRHAAPHPHPATGRDAGRGA